MLKIVMSKKKGNDKLGLNEDGSLNINEILSTLSDKTADEKDNQTANYLDWLTEKNNAVKSSSDALLSWKEYITNKAKQDGINVNNKDELDRYTSTFEKNNPNDPTFVSYQRKVEDNDFKMKAMDWIGTKAEDKLKSENTSSIQTALTESKKYGPGVQKLVKDMIDGNVEYDEWGNTLNALSDNNRRTVVKNTRGDNNYQVNSEDWRKANSIAGKLGENLEERRRQLLSAEYTRFQGYREFTDPDNAGFKKLQETVETKLGVKKGDITVRGYDRNGKLFVQLNSVDPKEATKFTNGIKGVNNGILTLDQSFKKDKGLFIIANGKNFGFNLNVISDPKVSLLKSMASLEEQQNPNKNSYFIQPNDWPLKLDNEYFKFEMHYVDGKEHWFPIHVKSGVKLREENGGYDTVEQAISELSNPNNKEGIKQIILYKKPDYKF